MSTAVSVDELQRAWSAVVAGQFRASDPGRRTTSAGWTPSEPVIVVAGAAGRVGASTVAVAMATAGQQKVRVIECGPMHATGLAAATTAELGVTSTGWCQGTRDQVVIERTTASFEHVLDVPTPDPTNSDSTVVDASWDLSQIANAGSWLETIVQSAPLVIVTVATVPGLRALDNALHLTARPDHTWCVVRGPRLSKWPKALHLSTTPSIDNAKTAGRLFAVPEISSLALRGLTPDPLPSPLVAACGPVFDQALGHAKGILHAPL